MWLTSPLFFLVVLSPRFLVGGPVVVFSPPKCGTHLIAKAICLITQREVDYALSWLGSRDEFLDRVLTAEQEGRCVVAHNLTPPFLNALRTHRVRLILMMRDPRDQIVSMCDWMEGGEWHWLHVSHIADWNARLSELITGARFGWRCCDHCLINRWKAFRCYPPSLRGIVRFEALVGEQGGGSRERQQKEIVALAHFLGIELTESEVDTIVDKLFGGTKTFHKGQIGRWRNCMTPDQKNSFAMQYSKWIRDWGYE